MASRNRFVVLSIVLSVLIVVIAGVLNVALTGMKSSPSEAAQRTPSTAVTTIEAVRTDYREQLVGYGRAQPLNISDVSASVSGDVVWRSPKLEPGTYVAANVELLRIDDRDLKTAMATARARLAQA